MATTTGRVASGSVQLRIGVVTGGLMAAGLVAILGFIVLSGQRPAPTSDAAAQQVEKALIDVRAGERAVLTPADEAQQVEKALIDVRAGERAVLPPADEAQQVEKALIDVRAGERAVLTPAEAGR